MAAPLHSLARASCDSFKDLEIAGNLALRAPDCVHVFAPPSLKMPPMTNTQWAAHASGLKAILSSFPVIAKETFAEDGRKTVTICAVSDARFEEEVMDAEQGLEWSCYGEYMFVLQVQKEIGRIERIVEFLDSTKVKQVQMFMGRAKANLAKRQVGGK